MKRIFTTALVCLLMALAAQHVKAQVAGGKLSTPQDLVPWTQQQLIEPADLAAQLDKKTKPLILNIGAVEDIKGAKHIGPVSREENMKALENTIAHLPKNTEIVIYCGCCPFSKCPNIRPAFNAIQRAGFNNVRVLDLPVNLKTNWTAKGYPLQSE